MASSEKTKVNETRGSEFKAPCTNCSGKTYHEVLLSLDKRGEENDGDYSFSWDSHYQIVECRGCKTISFRNISSNSEEYEQVSHDEWQSTIFENLYPSRVEGRKGIGDESVYLPVKVQRIYAETLQALNSESPVLAGVGLRALVETVCKEEDAVGRDLFNKIDNLVERKILTPAGAGILHKIRTLGNEAAHEVKPHSDKQLSLAIEVVEHLLVDVYILPKKVASEFGGE